MHTKIEKPRKTFWEYRIAKKVRIDIVYNRIDLKQQDQGMDKHT